MINDELDALLDAVETGLTVPVSHVSVQPGGVAAWDSDCGMLYVRVADAQPVQKGPCNVSFVTVNVQVGVLRCVHTVDSQGRAPTAESITDDGHQMVSDMTDMARVLACYQPSYAEQALMGQWTPLGPQGGMAGGEWRVSLQFVSI